MYSSQFQIGFVARVFDFLFVEGSLTLFKISLAVLYVHKAILLSCDSFESIVNHLKSTIPEMSLIESELIMSKAYSETPNSLNENLAEDLKTFELEFNIFYEEFLNSLHNNANLSPNNQSQNGDSIERLNLENLRLKKELKDVKEKYHEIMLKMLNSDDEFFKILNDNKQLKCRIECLELERDSFINKIQEQDSKIHSYHS